LNVNMQGIQKIKCATCGTMFMSENSTSQCPTCQEQSHSHDEQQSSNVGGGCGCGHSH
jgi:rubrerythrin